MFFHMTSQSFDRGYTNAFTSAMVPILRFLYKGREDADQEIRDGLKRTRSYYLCEQSFSGIAFAIIVGMEEKRANGQPISGEAIAATRTSIIGPMSGLGDTIHGSTTRQLSVALTIPFCLAGNWHSALWMLGLLNISPLLVALLGVPQGYKNGSAFVLTLVKSGFIQKITPVISAFYMVLFGAIAAKYSPWFLQNMYGQNISNRTISVVLVAFLILCFYISLIKKIKLMYIFGSCLTLGIFLALIKILSSFSHWF